MSKFGTLAIARVEKDSTLTVLSTGFESKAEAAAEIDDKLHNGEAGSILQILRLDSKFAAREVTELKVTELE